MAKLLRSDGVDDVIAADLTGLSTAYAVIANRYGWMVTGNQQISGATAWRLPLNDPSHVMLRATAFTASELAALATYFGTTQQYAVFVTYDTTIFHRFDTTPATQITFIGANGVQYQTTNNDVTTDVGAQGLTTPVTMLLPLSVYDSLTYLLCSANGLIGHIPALPSGLTYLSCYNNRLTGSIPTLPASLTYLDFSINDLTGSIPALPSGLTYLYCYSNRLTGSIPTLPASLTLLVCSTNQLTGYDGVSVSASLGHVQLENNLLTQSAVDGILVQLAAAGKNSGTRICNLGGTGNAAPSATGLSAKTTLEGLGWTVTVN